VHRIGVASSGPQTMSFPVDEVFIQAATDATNAAIKSFIEHRGKKFYCAETVSALVSAVGAGLVLVSVTQKDGRTIPPTDIAFPLEDCALSEVGSGTAVVEYKGRKYFAQSFTIGGSAFAGTATELRDRLAGEVFGAGDYASYEAFGDSITYGEGATSAAQNYVAQLGAAIGRTPINRGVSGTQAADQFDHIYPIVPSATARQLFSYLIGTNDNWIYGTDANKQANFSAFHRAALAYLAIPNENKLLAQGTGIAYGGVWSNSTRYGGAIAKQSTTNGATATFAVYGPVVYVAYTIEDGSGGTFSLSVDGSVVGTYAAKGQNAALIATNSGRTYGSALLRLDGLSYTNHTIVLTVTSATASGNAVQLDWAAGCTGHGGANAPMVLAGGVPRQNTAGNGLDTRTQQYTALIRSNVAQLAADGLNIRYADVPGFTIPTTDFTADGVHPNDTGYTHIKEAFLSSLNGGAHEKGYLASGQRVGDGVGAADFSINGGARTNRRLRMQTAGLDRWAWVVNAYNETGVARAGSDLELVAYDDAGALYSYAIKVIRSNGHLLINSLSDYAFLTVGGSLATAYHTVSAALTLNHTHHTVECTANTFTITLPTAAGINGREYIVLNSGTGVITLNTSSAQTINGSASYTMSAQWKRVKVKSNGTNWVIIENN
jgi:lysophospholipase L1-like esterase